MPKNSSKKRYVDDAVVSEAPEELMEETSSVVSENVSIGHKLTRPKRPERMASGDSEPRSYRVICDSYVDLFELIDGEPCDPPIRPGRHFVFFQSRADSGRPTQCTVNRKPYTGEIIENPGVFYGRLKKEGFEMKQCGVGRNFDKYAAMKIVGCDRVVSETPPVHVEEKPVRENMKQTEFDFISPPHPDSADWRGAGWFGRAIQAQYGFGGHPERYYHEYMSYAEEIMNETSDLFDTYIDTDKLSFILERIFKMSVKYSEMKSELYRINYEENPIKERNVAKISQRIDEMCDSAISMMLPGFKRWIYRHDDFDGWWSEFAYKLLTEGKSDQGYAGTFDIRDEITEAAEKAAKNQMASDYIDAEYYAESYFEDFINSRPEIVFNYLTANYADEIADWIETYEVNAEDFEDRMFEFIEDERILSDLANEIPEFEEWLTSDESPVFNFESFEGALEWFGDGNPYWIEIVKEVAEEYGMEYWRQLYPGMENIEEDVRKAIDMMEGADTPMEKMVAINYSLNVQHYHGSMMEDHVGVDMSELTGLDTDELDRLSNLEAASFMNMMKTADSVWTQSQVYCEDGTCYDVEKLIDETESNKKSRVKVSEIADQLSTNAWGDDRVFVSPISVMQNPVLNIDHKIHMRRIQTADMDKPILIRFRDGKVIDGYHRLARAYIAKDRYIDAIFIQEEQFLKAEIKS